MALDSSLWKLAGELADYPDRWAAAAFRWGEGDLADVDRPDDWQIDYLEELGREIRKRGFDGIDPVEPVRMATSSGHGIGKSALVAILILFIMTTRPMCRGAVTAVTNNQLQTKTWPELKKWQRRCLWGDWFDVRMSAGNLCIFHVDYPENWRCDGYSPAKENSEAFAGLHARESSPFFIFDEASGVPEEITTVAQGGLTDGEPFFFLFGNPTKNSGMFKQVFTRLRHRWIRRQIDSRKVRWTNKALIKQWIDDYGEDSDFVRVRVRGVFPRMSDMQFFNSEQVMAAMKREVPVMPDDPIVLSVDCARFGEDRSVIMERRGFDCKHWPPTILQGYSTTTLIGKIIERCEAVETQVKRQPDAIFVDVGNIGGAVVDRLKELGYLQTFEVDFGAGSDWPLQGADRVRVKNKRAEIYARGRANLRHCALWESDDLLEEMNGIDYSFGNDGVTMQIARKEDIRRPPPVGLGYSPDLTDAYCLLWAYPVMTKEQQQTLPNFQQESASEWWDNWRPE